jgi:hypothetical protein
MSRSILCAVTLLVGCSSQQPSIHVCDPEFIRRCSDLVEGEVDLRFDRVPNHEFESCGGQVVLMDYPADLIDRALWGALAERLGNLENYEPETILHLRVRLRGRLSRPERHLGETQPTCRLGIAEDSSVELLSATGGRVFANHQEILFEIVDGEVSSLTARPTRK